MRIYKCLMSDAELFTDAKGLNFNEEICAYYLESKMKESSNEGYDQNIGANASAEEQCEQLEVSVKRDKDLVLDFQYQEYGKIDTKAALLDFKEYCKQLKKFYEEKYPDQVQDMMEGAKKYGAFFQKSLKKDLENCELYLSSAGYSQEYFQPFVRWEDNSEKCVFYFFKYATYSEKC